MGTKSAVKGNSPNPATITVRPCRPTSSKLPPPNRRVKRRTWTAETRRGDSAWESRLAVALDGSAIETHPRRPELALSWMRIALSPP